MLYRRVVKWFLNLFMTISFSTPPPPPPSPFSFFMEATFGNHILHSGSYRIEVVGVYCSESIVDEVDGLSIVTEHFFKRMK